MSYKWWLLVAIVLFGIGLVLGLATPPNIRGLPAENVAALKRLADLLAPLPKSSFLAVVFIKNVSAIVISLALSPVFCLVPAIALTLNGWILGLVSTAVLQEKSLGYLLAGLLPHGIFELPALIMGEAVALSFGTGVIIALFRKEGRSNLVLSNLKRNLKYLVVAVSLLLLAGIIETYVTPLFLS